MAFNFPDNPSIGDAVFIGSYKYIWNGSTWEREVIDFQATIDSVVSSLVDSAPTALDTLNELAAALGDDPNFATTVTNSLAAKADTTTVNNALATKATTELYSFTIAAADTWTDQTGYFTLAKTVSGVLATDTPILDLDLSAATLANIADIQTAWGTIYRAVTSADTITLYALEAPVFPEDTVIKVKVVR